MSNKPPLEIDKEVRKGFNDQLYEIILDRIDYLVMLTPTGKAREDLTSARIYVVRAKQHAGRARA